jgi:hypothetical protein
MNGDVACTCTVPLRKCIAHGGFSRPIGKRFRLRSLLEVQWNRSPVYADRYARSPERLGRQFLFGRPHSSGLPRLTHRPAPFRLASAQSAPIP